MIGHGRGRRSQNRGVRYSVAMEQVSSDRESIARLRAELAAECKRRGLAEDELAKRIADYDAEVAEFNAGYHAARAGTGEDEEPADTHYDVWTIGYAWYKYPGLKAELARVKNEVAVYRSTNSGRRCPDAYCWVQAARDTLIDENAGLRAELVNVKAERNALKGQEANDERKQQG